MNDIFSAILIALLICSVTVALAAAVALWFDAPKNHKRPLINNLSNTGTFRRVK